MSVPENAIRRACRIIAVPFDSGRRDVRMGRGPDHLLARGLADRLGEAGVDVTIAHVEPPANVFPGEIRVAFELQRGVAEQVVAARRSGAFPLVLSGNCNMSVGTVAGLTTVAGRAPTVCWFDAHADFNTPDTTVGGFLDGMAVATLAGRCWQALAAQIPGFRPIDESRIVLLGTRDVDPLEAKLLEASAVRSFASPPADLVDAVVRPMMTDGSELYLHVDLDALDPSCGRANSYAAAGGLTASELLGVVGALGDGCRVGAMALTAYDPAFDESGAVARVAIDLAARVVTATTTFAAR